VSDALTLWDTDRKQQIALAQQLAHSMARGTSADPALTDLHLTTYIMVCCSEFQAFCSDLFKESSQAIYSLLAPQLSGELTDVLISQLNSQTALARGNPNLNNLISDYGRLGVNVRKSRLVRVGPATNADVTALDEELLAVRNELAHGNGRVGGIAVGSTGRTVTLTKVNEWLRALNRLARTIDRVVADDLTAPLGARPW